MHPLDDVVAHIERMHPFGQDLHAEGVFIAGRLERLGPPVSAFDQGIADERRRAAVEIIDDGLDHRAALGTGVNAFQPVPHGIAATHGFAERRGHVVEVDTETAGAFIGLADFIAICGQGHEGVVDRQRHRFRIGRDRADFRARIGGLQGQERVDLDILREGPGGLCQRGAAGLVDRETALIGVRQLVGRPDRIAGKEAGEIDQHPALFLGQDVRAPDHRAGKGLPGRPRFVGIGTDGAVAGILELGKDAVIDAEEAQDLRTGAQAPVKPDRVGPETGGQARRVDHPAQRAVIAGTQLGQDAAVRLVDKQRHEAVPTLQPFRFGCPVLSQGGGRDGKAERNGG